MMFCAYTPVGGADYLQKQNKEDDYTNAETKETI